MWSSTRFFVLILFTGIGNGERVQTTIETDAPTAQNGSRLPRSIGNFARLLLGGSYVTLQLGNVPPDHPLVQYPDPIYSPSSISQKVIASVPGMTGNPTDPQLHQPAPTMLMSGDAPIPAVAFGSNVHPFANQPSYSVPSQWSQQSPQFNQGSGSGGQFPGQGQQSTQTGLTNGYNQVNPGNSAPLSYGFQQNNAQAPANTYNSNQHGGTDQGGATGGGGVTSTQNGNAYGPPRQDHFQAATTQYGQPQGSGSNNLQTPVSQAGQGATQGQTASPSGGSDSQQTSQYSGNNGYNNGQGGNSYLNPTSSNNYQNYQSQPHSSQQSQGQNYGQTSNLPLPSDHVNQNLIQPPPTLLPVGFSFPNAGNNQNLGYNQNPNAPPATYNNNPTAYNQNPNDPPTYNQNTNNPTNLNQKPNNPPIYNQNADNPTNSYQNPNNPPTYNQNTDNPTNSYQNPNNPPTYNQNANNPTNSYQKPNNPPTYNQNENNPTNSYQKPNNPPTYNQNSNNPTNSYQKPNNPPTYNQNSNNPTTSYQKPNIPPTYNQNADNPTNSYQKPNNLPTYNQNANNPTNSYQKPNNPPTYNQNANNPATYNQNGNNPATYNQSPNTPPTYNQNANNPASYNQIPSNPTNVKQNPNSPANSYPNPNQGGGQRLNSNQNLYNAPNPNLYQPYRNDYSNQNYGSNSQSQLNSVFENTPLPSIQSPTISPGFNADTVSITNSPPQHISVAPAQNPWATQPPPAEPPTTASLLAVPPTTANQPGSGFGGYSTILSTTVRPYVQSNFPSLTFDKDGPSIYSGSISTYGVPKTEYGPPGGAFAGPLAAYGPPTKVTTYYGKPSKHTSWNDDSYSTIKSSVAAWPSYSRGGYSSYSQTDDDDDGSYRPPTPVYKSKKVNSYFRSPTASRYEDSHDNSYRRSSAVSTIELVDALRQKPRDRKKSRLDNLSLDVNIPRQRTRHASRESRDSSRYYAETFKPLRIGRKSPIEAFPFPAIDIEGLPLKDSKVEPSVALFHTSYI